MGDYDNDGYDDIYISGYRTGLLLHNEQGQAFQDVTAQAGLKPQPWGTSCAFGDMDGDGKLDLYVGNYLDFGPQTTPQLCNADGSQTACGPLYYQPERGVLYRNLGGGRFQDVTRALGRGQGRRQSARRRLRDYRRTGARPRHRQRRGGRGSAC